MSCASAGLPARQNNRNFKCALFRGAYIDQVFSLMCCGVCRLWSAFAIERKRGRKWVDAMGNAKERAGHRLGHLGGIACAGGRQSPIVFNGMEMLFSHGATHLFQLNGNVDVDWCEKHISMELKWLRLSVRRTGFNSIEIVAPLLRRILAYPVSLTSREAEPRQKLFAATSLSCLFCKSVFYRKTAGGCRAFCRRWSSQSKNGQTP